MDEFLVCSDLCEEKGFQRQAELLRAAAGAGGKAFLVAERGYEYNDECNYLSQDGYGNLLPGQPRTVYFNRAEAERAADLRNAQAYRETNVLGFGLTLQGVTDLSEAELNRRIGAILGTDFRVFGERGEDDAMGDFDGEPPPYAAGATDEQMVQIAGLFKVRFCHVIEVEFGG